MSLKHIYWFAPHGLIGPSCRYRAYYPLKTIKSEFQITYDFVYPSMTFNGIIKFLYVLLKALFLSNKDSAIVIQKVCSNRIYARLLKILVLLRNKNTIYDIDDAEYLRNSDHTLIYFLRKCRTITVGSRQLESYCKKFNPNVKLNTSPVISHSFKKQKRNKIPNIGWVGDFGNGKEVSREFSHKTSIYKILFPQLKRIQIPFKLSIIGVKNSLDIPEIFEYFKNCSNIKVDVPDNLNWEEDFWVYDKIKDFDIGVSPLVNHEFNESKSAFKAKQYLSAGIPVIASSVGENNYFVKHGESGFLCKNGLEF